MIDGLVIGSRKAGTSWLHANLLKDKFFSTTVHTKETNYWGVYPRCGKDQYKNLFQQNNGQFRVECDASLCTDPLTIQKLTQSNINPSIVLILRNPREFLVSRYIHSKRKGEINNSVQLSNFLLLDWVQTEIDYESMIQKFSNHFSTSVIKFENIHKNPYNYYLKICRSLSCDYLESNEFTLETNKMNQMRTSRFPLLSKAQTLIATKMRNMGLHQVVDTLKKTNIHSTWEAKNDDTLRNNLYREAAMLNHESLFMAHHTWNKLD